MIKVKNNSDATKLVSFIQHDLPGLRDGKYQLQVVQNVTDADGNAIGESIDAEYKFAVTGDRFSLTNPKESIYSVFPAHNASGRYDTILPSVVFTKTSLPWSRSPYNKTNDRQLRAGVDTDQDVATWMTILLMDEQDILKYGGDLPTFSPEVKVLTIADLFPTVAVATSTLGDNYAYFTGVTKTEVETVLEPGQLLTDTIRVIDIPVPLFRAIAPSVDDLKYMAHIRKVSLVNKATMKGVSDVGEPEGSFSILFGNRIPGSNRKTYAYLVSLEMMEHLLPGGDKEPDNKKMVRLAVLDQWSFYSTGDNASFVDRLRHLNRATPTDKTSAVNADLSINANIRLLPVDNASAVVAAALNMGYMPMNHHLRSAYGQGGGTIAEKTVSWYRGPLVPYMINQQRVRIPIASADKASIFDPTTGMLDISYSSAWSIGRQMALQDKAFSTRLFNWKKQTEARIEQRHELNFFAGHFRNIMTHQDNVKMMEGNKANDEKEEPESFLKKALMSLNTKNE